MQFDEKVHLVSVGGGFLRTPFLTSTQEATPNLAPGECPVQGPQIIHLPAAGRKNGMNLRDPAFRRAIFTSTLCKRLTRDGAAQTNHEASGVTFDFSDSPDRNLAHARVSPGLLFEGERIMLLDDIGAQPGRSVDVNIIPPATMATGFLAFVSRYWQDLRHVDRGILLRHLVPLQIDCDFDIIPLSSKPFKVFLPIIGNQGTVIVYDQSLGPSSYNPSGSPIGDFGSATIEADSRGGYYVSLEMIPAGEAVINLVIADTSGQTYARNLIIQDGFPAGAVVRLPHGMVGVPYYSTLPCTDVLCRIYGQDCPSGNIDSDIDSMTLPAGLSLTPDKTAIVGTPTVYGTNYGILPTGIAQEGLQSLGISLTVNRPPRTLMVIADEMANDIQTGEYYAVQFMPYGSTLVYGGQAFEFRRFLATDQAWPGVRRIPYTYGSANHLSAKAQEGAWKEAT